jgi:hypothetical protein
MNGASGVADFRHVWIVIGNCRSALYKKGDNVRGGSIACVLDVRLEGNADDSHMRAAQRG